MNYDEFLECDQLRVEKAALDDKIWRLRVALHSRWSEMLDMEEKRLMQDQLVAMCLYADALDKRIINMGKVRPLPYNVWSVVGDGRAPPRNGTVLYAFRDESRPGEFRYQLVTGRAVDLVAENPVAWMVPSFMGAGDVE